jgi:hypothetical protein
MARIIISFFLFIASLNVYGQVSPTITITSDKSVITVGETINFTASFSGGGTIPKLEWKKNGVLVGSNAVNFSDNTLKVGDKIACVLTSNDPQRVMNVVASNFLSPTVNPVQINPTLSGEGIVGKSITLNSNVTEKVVWKKDGIIISNPLKGNLGGGKMVAGNIESKVGLTSPGKIFIDKCGKIYVCESFKNRILRYDSENSDPIIVAGGNGKGTGLNQLYEANDLFVDETSTLYIADGSRIVKWLPGATSGSAILNLNSGTTSIFIDDLGDIYFNDYFNHKVFKCKNDGSNIIQVAGGTGSAISNSGNLSNQLKYPQGIFVDKNYDLYIADGSNHRIQKWKPGATSGITVAGGNGNAYEINPGTNISNQNQLSFPNDVYVDKDLNIFISSSNDARIQKWELNSITGITVAGGNGQGSSSNQFSNTESVFLNRFGDIIISDSRNSRIQKWKQGSTIGETIAGSRFTASSITLSKPSAIQIDKKNNDLYVADWGTIQITKWPDGSLNGSLLASNLSFYSGMSNPTGLILNPDGSMYITQRVANNVIKWTSSLGKGSTVAGGTLSGSTANLLNSPVSSFVDKNDNLYIADSGNHRIQKWKPGATSGITVAGGNGQGSSSNQLNYPSAIYVDSVGKMYIIDKSNSRILVWKEGELISTKNVNISNPNSIKVDSYGNFYTISASEVVKFDNNLNNPTVIVAGKDVGNTSNVFSDPQDLEVDKFGNIYVADYGNGRVQKFILENSQSIIPNSPGNYTAIVTTQFGEFTTPIYKTLAQDTDKDGIEDALDKCSNTPAGEQVDSNGCSLSQKDTDNDGINDKLDKCSTTKTGFKVDANGCADYQKDTDNDGITDDIDKCQGTPTGIKVDAFGCSDAQKDTCSNVKPTIILKNGLELSTPLIGVGYVWYLNEIKIPNAINSTYLATSSGRYSVQVLKTATCITGVSENIFVQITGTNQENNQFIVFPNPFTKDIKIEFPPEYGSAVKVSISDIKGSIVYSKERVINSEILNLSFLNTGVYLITIYSNHSSEKRVFKLLKE